MSAVSPGTITENYRRIRDEVPAHVAIVAAAKTRTPEEIAEAIEAGARIIGQNYVQEAEAAMAALGEAARQVEWHMIGRLQRNKVNKALPLFDVVQTVDAARLAGALDARAEGPLRVYVEVNVAGEESKSGVAPEGVRSLLQQVGEMQNLRVEGLMTMEPYFEDPERARPYLRRMKGVFDEMRGARLPGVDLQVLSMGMTNSYRVAIEEGANMVRIGTAIFGPRAS
jgi:pyridoxal phosphate enzyme (YggS family)